MKPSHLNLRTMVLGLVALGFVACQGSPGPTAVPEGAGYETTTINGVQLLHTPPGQRLMTSAYAYAIIGPEGGTIEKDGGRLTIPAGALAAPVLIAEQGREAPHYQYRFGPSGLQFATPATLSIKINPAEFGIDPSLVKVAGSDDLGLWWTVLGGTYDPVTQTLNVPIHHFSQYALCID